MKTVEFTVPTNRFTIRHPSIALSSGRAGSIFSPFDAAGVGGVGVKGHSPSASRGGEGGRAFAAPDAALAQAASRNPNQTRLPGGLPLGVVNSARLRPGRIHFEATSGSFNVAKPMSLALVGRFHPQRGDWLAVGIARSSFDRNGIHFAHHALRYDTGETKECDRNGRHARPTQAGRALIDSIPYSPSHGRDVTTG